MEPVAPVRQEPPHCSRCGREIDLQDRQTFVSHRVGLTGREYLHIACMTARDRQEALDELTREGEW